MAEIRLKCLSKYSNGREVYRAGQVFAVDETHARWLQNDAPGCFEVYVEPKPRTRRRRVRKPAQDKAVEAAPEEK